MYPLFSWKVCQSLMNRKCWTYTGTHVEFWMVFLFYYFQQSFLTKICGKPVQRSLDFTYWRIIWQMFMNLARIFSLFGEEKGNIIFSFPLSSAFLFKTFAITFQIDKYI